MGVGEGNDVVVEVVVVTDDVSVAIGLYPTSLHLMGALLLLPPIVILSIDQKEFGWIDENCHLSCIPQVCIQSGNMMLTSSALR